MSRDSGRWSFRCVVIKVNRLVVVALSSVLFATGCYLLVFGGVMSCCASGRPAEGFSRFENLIYGLVPTGVSIVILAVAIRLWVRTFVRRRNACLVGCVVAGLVIVGDLGLFFWTRGSPEEVEFAWEAESGVFYWGSGEIKLPPGFTHESLRGIDSRVGRFTSLDGEIAIEYDIGELAGDRAAVGNFRETLTGGSRVRVTHRRKPDNRGNTTIRSSVSFRDNRCANFFLDSSNEDDAAIVDFIARSFRPKDRKPSWLRPLLPEILRADCRH